MRASILSKQTLKPVEKVFVWHVSVLRGGLTSETSYRQARRLGWLITATLVPDLGKYR